jgi:hypothetical protein
MMKKNLLLGLLFLTLAIPFSIQAKIKIYIKDDVKAMGATRKGGGWVVSNANRDKNKWNVVLKKLNSNKKVDSATIKYGDDEKLSFNAQANDLYTLSVDSTKRIGPATGLSAPSNATANIYKIKITDDEIIIYDGNEIKQQTTRTSDRNPKLIIKRVSDDEDSNEYYQFETVIED